jgi:hypothetical protein
MSDHWRVVPGTHGYVAVDAAGGRYTPAALTRDLLTRRQEVRCYPPDSAAQVECRTEMSRLRALLDALRAAEALRPRGDRT